MLRRTISLIAAGTVALALGGCGRSAEHAAATNDQTPPRSDSTAYVTPPRPTAITATDGGVTVKGRASPGVRVRAVTTDGPAYGATVADDGRFTLDLPAAHTPRLLALSSEDGARSVPGEGRLFVPPDAPAHAVMLRPGAPAEPLPTGTGLMATVDFDAGGGAAVSGRAAPGAKLRLYLDGSDAGDAVAGADGVYGARLSTGVSPGAHLVRVVAGPKSQERTVSFTPANGAAPFAAVREADSWRVTWVSADGGAQTTVVFLDGAR